MKILVAEDSQSALKLIERLLKTEGYDFESYTDGRSALDALMRSDSPQIVILDWMMPEMSGLEVCQKLNASQLHLDKYIIILSAKDDKEDIARILNAGAHDYVTKPMNKDEFLARLKVAQRTLSFQNELRDKTRQLEDLVRKHNLLGEMVSHTEIAFEGEEEAPTNFLRYDEESSTIAKALRIDALSYLNRLVKPALERMGLTVSDLPANEPDTHNPVQGSALSWTSVVVESNDLWLDLVLEFPLGQAFGFLENVLNIKDPTQADIEDVASQMLSLIQGALSKYLNTQNIAIGVPFVPEASLVDDAPLLYSVSKNRIQWNFECQGYKFSLNLFCANAPAQQRFTSNLHIGDVLSADIAPVERKETVLIKKWEVITDSHLRYIHRWVSFNTIADTVHAYTPPLIHKQLHDIVVRYSKRLLD